jgi:hypothetical protein
VRLYRYFDAFGALQTIEQGMLRVARLDRLNDPFEFMPALSGLIDGAHEIAEFQMRRFVGHIGQNAGVICFSAGAREPVLWSHYADHHRGIVLEFSVTDDTEKCLKLEYSDQRPTIDVNQMFGSDVEGHALPTLKDLIRRKSSGWAYEKEYRLYEKLAECEISGGYYYRPFDKFALRRVIVGWRSDVELSYIIRALAKAGFEHCLATKARAVEGSYSVDFDSTDQFPDEGFTKLGDE